MLKKQKYTMKYIMKPLDYFSMAAFRTTRASHSKKIMPKFGRVNAVKFSFFFSVIPIWNSLPDNIVNQCNSEYFHSLCRNHFSKR